MSGRGVGRDSRTLRGEVSLKTSIVFYFEKTHFECSTRRVVQ